MLVYASKQADRPRRPAGQHTGYARTINKAANVPLAKETQRVTTRLQKSNWTAVNRIPPPHASKGKHGPSQQKSLVEEGKSPSTLASPAHTDTAAASTLIGVNDHLRPTTSSTIYLRTTGI